MNGNYLGQGYLGQGYAGDTATITTRDQTGQARLQVATARTQTGKAAVKRTTQRTQTGKARVQIVTNISYQVDQSQTTGLGFAMGWSTGHQSWYQTFTPSISKPLGKIDIIAGIDGSPADSLQVKVYVDNAGSPGALVETAGNTVAGNTIWGSSGNGQILSFLFANTNVLTAGTVYGIEVSRTGAVDGSNFYYLFRRSSTDTDYAGGTLYEYQTSAYVDLSRDMVFYQYWQSNPQTGRARITAASNRTQSGIARITASTTRNLTGTANISTLTTSTRNQAGVARLQITTSRVQTGISRITRVRSQTQTGLARLTLITARTQTGVSRLTATASRAQTGVAHITVTATHTQSGMSRIEIASLRTITGVARVTLTTQRTQAGIANIIRQQDYSWAAVNTLPTNADPLANAYSTSQITDTATQDSSYVDAVGTNRYLVHLFRDLMTGSETALSRTWIGRMSRPASVSTVFLQIYNFNTASWETVDSDNAGTSPLSLGGTVNTNVAHYFDANNITAWRVYQEVQ